MCVKTFATRAEAELGKSLLDADGIASVLAADDAGGMRPEIGLTTGGAKLLVEPDDAERASDVLTGLGLQRLDHAQFQVLNTKAHGCVVPALLGMLLFAVAAFVEHLVSWLGYALVFVAIALVLLAVVRGVRAV